LKLRIDESRFALRYAIFYTLVVLGILLFPFAIYLYHTVALENAKTKLLLKKRAYEIVERMERFDPQKEEVFRFPRFRSVKAGLYDANGDAVFSLIERAFAPFELQPGYHKRGLRRYYVLQLPQNRYFGARYLVVEGRFDLFRILFDALLILLSIAAVTFALSFVILRSFSRPFRQINKALDEFIKDSMHEINTPLSIININADMLAQKIGKNPYISRIKSAAKILSSLYDDMNYLIKERTIQKAKKRPIDMSAFVKRSVDYFGDIAELRGVRLEADIEDGITIDFVPQKLQKIIDNNLSNAIKYSKEGGRVIVSLRRTDKGIELGFRDYGIGIKEPEKIFSRYYREDHTKGGFGIGLDIVGKIVRDEGIEVQIDSEPGKGSHFLYIFPFKKQ